jgi:hypothetical protein
MYRPLTDAMIGQVVSNVVTGSSRPNDNHLLPNVLLRSRIFKGVNDLALEFFL